MKKGKIKKVKKAKLPLNKMSKKEKDYVAVVLEEVRSNFMVFGETLNGFGDKLELVKQKGDATFEEVGRIKIEIVGIKGEITGLKGEMVETKEEITGMKGEIGGIKKEIAGMNGRLDRIEREVSLIRSEIEILKDILTKKVDIDYVKRLEVRLIRVEKHLKLSAR